MTLADLEEDELLSRARRGLAPRAGDAERVRSALTLALAPGAAVSKHDPAPTAPDARSALGATIPNWVATLVVSLGVAATAGSAGYYFGFRAGASSAFRARAAEVAPAARVAPVESVTSAPAPAQTVPVPPPEPRSPPSRAQASGITPPASSASPSPSAGNPSLWEETRLLARVERALRDGNPRLALGLLGELERSVPGGQLREERAAARALGLCALASEPSPEIWEDFSKRYPGSAYLPRIAERCGRSTKARP